MTGEFMQSCNQKLIEKLTSISLVDKDSYIAVEVNEYSLAFHNYNRATIDLATNRLGYYILKI